MWECLLSFSTSLSAQASHLPRTASAGEEVVGRGNGKSEALSLPLWLSLREEENEFHDRLIFQLLLICNWTKLRKFKNGRRMPGERKGEGKVIYFFLVLSCNGAKNSSAQLPK
jgi:hypothetical protein